MQPGCTDTPTTATGPELALTDVDAELRVSTLELFFDLVFVLTITQLTSLLARDVSPAGAMQVFSIFSVLFWMYGGYAWLTNQVPPVSSARRLLLIAGMAAFFVCALAVPRAFGASGLAFGLGYLLVVLVHGTLYAQVHGRSVLRFVPFNVAGAACLILASHIDGAGLYVLWLVPGVLQYVASYLTRRVDDGAQSGFDIRPSHFVERHGGLLIVVFGESVVAVGIGVADLTPSLSTVATAVLGLALLAALWWAYFGVDETRAGISLRSASMQDRVRMALLGYFYAFVPMLLGVTSLAAGVKLAITTIDARLPLGPALLLARGVGLYLLGDSLFRLALQIPRGAPRLGAVPVALLTVLLGIFVSRSGSAHRSTGDAGADAPARGTRKCFPLDRS
jgi:low temperature requirement protein LtrA